MPILQGLQASRAATSISLTTNLLRSCSSLSSRRSGSTLLVVLPNCRTGGHTRNSPLSTTSLHFDSSGHRLTSSSSILKSLPLANVGSEQFVTRHYFTSSHLRTSSKSSNVTPEEPKATATEQPPAEKPSPIPAPQPQPTAPEKNPRSEDIHVKPKVHKERIDRETTVGRNFITTTRAMREYALDIADLGDLRKFQRRSPYNNEPPITVYLRKDVEVKALTIWKSWERLTAELQKRKEKEESYSEALLIVKKYNKDYRRLNTPQAKMREDLLRESGRVVMAAVAINGANALLKFFGWLYTGSHSLFAESIHSLADTGNQLILAFGIRKSIQVPNKEHPYGYHPMRYIASLISGVGIFCTGTGLSVYHGVHGLLNPTPVESYYWAFIILAGSLVSEGGTLIFALQAAKKAAATQGVSLKDYIIGGHDPTLNVVILEDSAAVLGVGIAGTCMAATSFLNTPMFDAFGSLAIGCLLGAVASFVIVTNSEALVGRSIPADRLASINKCLESDSMVRAIHDVKATNMGNEVIRYKAEVDFDGRKLTRNYLDSVDLEALFKEFQDVETMEQCEEFMLKHGENIVDLLGAEVDRIENELKTKHPQVRHVDLEVL